MRYSLKIYVGTIYLLFFISLYYFWNGYDFKQVIETIGFIILIFLFNLDIIRDLQSNAIYITVLPFVAPSLVFLEPFYAMVFISISTMLIFRKLVWYKILFNSSMYGLIILISSLLFHHFFPIFDNSISIFSASFFILIILISLMTTIMTNIFVFIAVALEKGKFDINVLIAFISSTKSALITVFLGLINVVLFYYFNIVGVAIFTFLIYFIKPALQYREIFDNELSTYTNFVLHILKQMDPITHSHSERVKFWTVLLANKMGLPQAEIRQLSQAASWHDIGKIEIPYEILNKPNKLTQMEYEIIKSHPEKGYQLVKDMHFFKKFLPVIRHHHEKYDGTGYPLGLKGEKIPLHARIMAVTDAFDAMTADRSYRVGMPMKDAVDELIRYSGTQFDPEIVQVFVEALKEEYGANYEKFDKTIMMNVS
ncbi:HD domain-containing protein [Tepidibacillus fermentans]|uniref:HD domain-containing protein n=2 Tax=Tepidibacillus fermentans TaxID=1281767 RepID=A0A4V2UT15_9BACI|nr:HD domain-containing protein [Tepidibacillus fermentans]